MNVSINLICDTKPIYAFITMIQETLKNQNKTLDIDSLDFELIRVVKNQKNDGSGIICTIYPSDEFIFYISSIIELKKQDD